jgi:hypothetical protein
MSALPSKGGGLVAESSSGLSLQLSWLASPLKEGKEGRLSAGSSREPLLPLLWLVLSAKKGSLLALPSEGGSLLAECLGELEC